MKLQLNLATAVILPIFFLGFFFSSSLNVIAFSDTLSNSKDSLSSLSLKMTKNPEQLAGFGLIVKNKSGFDNQTSIRRLNLSGVKFQQVQSQSNKAGQSSIFSFKNLDELKIGLQTALLDPTVEIAQPNFKYHFNYNPSSNPRFNSTDQWYLQNGVSTMKAPAAWDAMQTRLGLSGCSDTGTNKQCGGLASTKIAVIDSGVNTNLAQVPEFTGTNFDVLNSMMFYNRVDNNCDSVSEFYNTLQDNNGNFINFCRKIGSQFDEIGHGSIVSQQIAGGNNSTGGLGLGYNLTLLPIALHGDSLNTYFIAKSIEYAADQGAAVINMSLGSSEDSYNFLESSLNYAGSKGTIAVVSSGNCGDVTEKVCFEDPSLSNNLNPLIYPAALSNTIAVGATNYGTSTGSITRSSYSSFGSHLDFVAPVGGGTGSSSPNGVYGQCGKVYNIAYNSSLPYEKQDPNYFDPCNGKCLATDPGFTAIPTPTCTNESKWYGTSFSSPQIAAVVGLMKSLDPALDFNNVMQILRENSTDIGAVGYDTQTGWGIPKVDQILLGMWRGWNQLGNGATVSKQTEQANYSVDGKLYQSIFGTDTRLYTRSTTDASTWSTWQEGAGITLKDRPKMIEFSGKLYQSAWGSDTKLYTRSSSDGLSWSTWQEGAGITLKDRPEMAVLGSKLVVTGFGSDNRMYTRSSSDGLTWSTWQEGAGITLKNTPSLTILNSKIFQSARGTDNRLYTRNSTDSVTWSSWIEANGFQMADQPSTIVFSGKIYQSGLGIDSRIYIRNSTDGITWSAWGEANGINALNQPDLIVFNSKLYQTARGIDNKIYTRSSSDGTTWANWNEASGITSSVKPATFVINSKMHQVTVGTDKFIWFRNRDN